MRLIDVLSKQEHKTVFHLRTCLVEAKTRNDIDYYTDECYKILEQAKARYRASKQVRHDEQAVTTVQ